MNLKSPMLLRRQARNLVDSLPTSNRRAPRHAVRRAAAIHDEGNKMMTRNRWIALATALALIMPGGARAHVSLERQEAGIGASYKAILRVPHGCEGAATLRVRVRIPEGFIAVKPMPKAGWTVETTKGPYAEAHPYYHGAMLTEGVREIVWQGRLADEHFDEFVFVGVMAKTLKEHTRLYFPTVQECERGQQAWVEIPAAGQSSRDLKYPAPSVRLIEVNVPTPDQAQKGQQDHQHHQHAQHAQHSGHGQPTAQQSAPVRGFKAGDLFIEAPWSRATPPGARVAAGFLKITNSGREADRLIGGSFELAKKLEVHEMTMSDNVMRMRQLAKGLEIKPGESVELRPSSYHLMLFDLARPLKAQEMVKGTLIFERAGTVQVEFVVAPLGAQSPTQKEGGHKSGGHKH
jgi:uncharacterized protein YcnI/copper(I)-binding protein